MLQKQSQIKYQRLEQNNQILKGEIKVKICNQKLFNHRKIDNILARMNIKKKTIMMEVGHFKQSRTKVNGTQVGLALFQIFPGLPILKIFHPNFFSASKETLENSNGIL